MFTPIPDHIVHMALWTLDENGRADGEMLDTILAEEEVVLRPEKRDGLIALLHWWHQRVSVPSELTEEIAKLKAGLTATLTKEHMIQALRERLRLPFMNDPLLYEADCRAANERYGHQFSFPDDPQFWIDDLAQERDNLMTMLHRLSYESH